MSFVTVTVNLPGAQSWDRAGSRAPPDCLNLSQSSARDLPQLPLERERETERLSGCMQFIYMPVLSW